MITSWTWGPRTYGLLFHVRWLSFFTALCFSILDTSWFNITVPRRINMTSPPFTNFTPHVTAPPHFLRQISSISELPYYVTTIFDAYSSASCTCTPLSNHSLSYFHFYPFFFCKIKVKINFFSPLTLSLDNSKKLCENYSIEFSGADHFYHFHKKIKKNNSIFQ